MKQWGSSLSSIIPRTQLISGSCVCPVFALFPLDLRNSKTFQKEEARSARKQEKKIHQPAMRANDSQTFTDTQTRHKPTHTHTVVAAGSWNRVCELVNLRKLGCSVVWKIKLLNGDFWRLIIVKWLKKILEFSPWVNLFTMVSMGFGNQGLTGRERPK